MTTDSKAGALHLKVRSVALWLKTMPGEASTVIDAAFETLLLAADALASTAQPPLTRVHQEDGTVTYQAAQPSAEAQGGGIDPLQDPMRPGYAMNYAEDETPAEMVLRKLACWLGVGGYNAPKVDAELFHRKIVAGIQMLNEGRAALIEAGQPRQPSAAPQTENGVLREALTALIGVANSSSHVMHHYAEHPVKSKNDIARTAGLLRTAAIKAQTALERPAP